MEIHEFLMQAVKSGQLILRMDMVNSRDGASDAGLDAELVSYWSDDEGAVVLHITYMRQPSFAPKLRVKVITWAFNIDQRNSEIETGLRTIAAHWRPKSWATESTKQVRRVEGYWIDEDTFDCLFGTTVRPVNLFAIQHLARWQGALEQASLAPETVTDLPENLSERERSFLISELKSALNNTVREFAIIIATGNRELNGFTKLI